MFSTKRGAAGLSIALNVLLIVTKLVIAIMIGSVSVLSEAIHSGIDLLASLIAFVGVGRADQPADSDHPFGHGKVESVSGLIEALLIVLAALLIVHEAWDKLVGGIEIESVDLGVVVMLISVIGNIVVSVQLLRVAKRTESIALEADALHHTTDILTSLGVLVGLVAVKITGLYILDPLVAMGVALLIIKTAIDLTRRSVVDLLDQQLPEAELAAIKDVINSYSGDFAEFHELRSRKSGSERHIDLHLVVSKNISVQLAHDLCDRLEEDIASRLPRAKVTIHVEPCSRPCEECPSSNCPEPELAKEEIL